MDQPTQKIRHPGSYTDNHPLQLNLMDYADIYRNINCLFHTLSVCQWDLSHGAPDLILLVG